MSEHSGPRIDVALRKESRAPHRIVDGASHVDFPAVMSLLSSIRGVSALVVVSVHAIQVFGLPYFGLYGAPHLVSSFMAAYAVIVFFIVSGFMIFISQHNHRDDAGRFDLGNFFLARALRIYPPLLAALALSLGVYLVVAGAGLHGADSFRLGGELFLARERVEFEWERLLATILLLYNVFPRMPPPLSINGPLWTLSIEWWFYLFVMFGAATIDRQSALRGVIPWTCLWVAFLASPSGVLFWALFFIWMGGFWLGSIYVRGHLASRGFYPAAALLLVLCASAIVLIGGKDCLSLVLEPLQRHGKRAHVVMMFVASMLTVGLAVLVRNGVSAHRMASTARFSYTLYLIHYPLLLLAFGLLHPALHAHGWIPSILAASVVTLGIVALASRVALVVEDRGRLVGLIGRLLSHGPAK